MTAHPDNPKSPIITKHEHLRMRVREYQQEVQKYIVPPYSEDKHSKLTLWGTGVLIQTGGNYYIATAAHVVSKIYKNGSDVLFASGRTELPGFVFSPENTTRNKWKFHPNPAYDLAVLPLSEPMPGLDFLEFAQHTHGHLPSMRGLYFMAGYPSSRNKLAKVNPSAERKQAFLASIIVGIDQTLDFETDKKNAVEFLGFRYQSIYEDGLLKPEGVSLHGMSGSGLWYFPVESTKKYLLAGILIEHHSKSHNGYATFAKFLGSIIE